MLLNFQSEHDRRHPVSGVNPLVVIIADLAMDSFYEFTDVVESFYVTEFQLEVVVERFLVAVLPGTSFATVGWLCVVI